ncbi:MAG: 3'(2'),5'-bisphosphate nucleotidase [Deltaproteobacteria bacterium]|nr:3'(2'),5'-bisphosphate nucleotidase [Deltaproteobacteria bacterium]MBW2123876.1 3'(2'),5'-bisphosphate nucleotidase [Deltaproteobacteria bacterium]
MNPGFKKEMDIAIRAVMAASSLCIKVRTALIEGSTMTKGDRSPVTVADFGSQALICKTLKEEFPHDPVVAEEDSQELFKPEHSVTLGQVVRHVHDFFPKAPPGQICSWIDWGGQQPGERFWTLDPIDGTKGFLRGDQYAIALALIESGHVQLGVLGCPNLPLAGNPTGEERGTLLVALKGRGTVESDLAGRNRTRVRVSPAATPVQARITESLESAHSDHASQSRIAQELRIATPALRVDSQAKYALLARGDASIYLRLPSPETPDYREKIWDHAAGSIIVEEAGGRVTDIFGRPLDFSTGKRLEKNKGIVATNGLLHATVLQAVTAALNRTAQG